MKIIELEDRTIYRASKGKKVKFVDSESRYSEIVINKEDEGKRKIVEVDN